MDGYRLYEGLIIIICKCLQKMTITLHVFGLTFNFEGWKLLLKYTDKRNE